MKITVIPSNALNQDTSLRCNGCSSPIEVGEPVYWRPDAYQGYVEPYHEDCFEAAEAEEAQP